MAAAPFSIERGFQSFNKGRKHQEGKKANDKASKMSAVLERELVAKSIYSYQGLTERKESKTNSTAVQ